MNKTTYLFAILFLCAVLIADLIQHVFWWQLGPEVITMQSFISWITLSSVTSVIAFSFLLRYFFLKGWKFVFLFTFLGWILGIVHFIIVYNRIVEVQHQATAYYNLVLISYRICMIIAGIGMVTATGKSEKVLKWSGALLAFFSLLLLLLSIPGMTGRSTILQQQIAFGVQVLSEIIWLLIIWLFAQETRKQSFTRQYSGVQKNALLGAWTIATVLLVFQFGAAAEVAREIGWYNEWKRRGPALNERRAKQFEDRIFVGNAGDTLRYFLMKPLNYDATLAYPIVTCLHGGGIGKGDIDIAEPAPFLIDSLNRKNYRAFIFVPQVTAGHSWGWLPGVPGMDSLVFGGLAALQLEFNLDADRYYIGGISGGGYGTWDYLSRRLDMFAAAIPMCGKGNPVTAARIAHIPVWAFHGEVDRNVPVSGSREMIEAMRAAGGTPKYSEFRGIGHNVWPEVQRTPGVLEWLFAQKKTGKKHCRHEISCRYYW